MIEIQQNNDITYRIYDCNRKEKRQLHIDESIKNMSKLQSKTCQFNNYDNLVGEYVLVDNSYFKVNKIKCLDKYSGTMNEDSCHIINVIECEDAFLIVDGIRYEINKGDCFILPVSINKYEINGDIEFIKSWM